MIRCCRLNSLFALIGVLFFLSGCVSVNLPKAASTKADKIDFQSPPTPFQQIKTESADRAWQSEKTGNTLAFVTECNQNADIQLKSLESESLNALVDPKILHSTTVFFDDRESLHTIAEGAVDGVPVKIALLTFQKNGCNFTLSFSGRKNKFDLESQVFERFKESFRVP